MAAPAPPRPGDQSRLDRLRTAYLARRSGVVVALGWLVSRALALVLLGLAWRYITGDVFYYRRKVAAWDEVGLAQTLVEYPTPVAWILGLPYLLTGGSRAGYLVAFVALLLVLDAVFTRLLWRHARRVGSLAAEFWMVFVLAVGPLAHVRFDILPAVLAGVAVLVARTRPGLAGALTGLGAAIKLWPALLIGALSAWRPGRRPSLTGFVAVGFGLALVSLLAAGWDRLVSPLTWQSDRGLQIESVWATPVMVARALAPAEYTVAMSRYQAYEVFGAGVTPALLLSTLATAAGLLVIVALSVRAWRSGGSSPVATGLVVLAVVAVMTVTNKTLSPQYLLWLGGPMAALLVLAAGRSTDGTDRHLVVRLAGWLLALGVLTQLVYPTFYNGLLGRRGDGLLLLATAVTALRNLALVVFTVQVCRLAWLSLDTSRATRSNVTSQTTIG